MAAGPLRCSQQAPSRAVPAGRDHGTARGSAVGAHAGPARLHAAARRRRGDLALRASLLHAKVLTVDGSVAMGGTANFDVRSLALNGQVWLLVDDPEVVAVLDGHFDGDLSVSERVTPQGWRTAR